MVKNSPANAGDTVWSWVGKVSGRSKWQTDSSVLDWRVSRTEESGGLQFMGSHRVGNDWANTHIETLVQPVAWCRCSLTTGWKYCPEFQFRNSPWTLSTYARGSLNISWVIQTQSLHGRCCFIFHSAEKARTQESESVSHSVASSVRLFTTPRTVARQAPLSMGFPRQEYWSGLPFPSPGIFPTQGSNPGPLHCGQILYCLSHRDLSP